MSTALTIGALAKATGTKVETARYYERIGLLPPPGRSPGGQRHFAPDHLKRLNFVRRSRGLGFSLDEIRTLLGLADKGEENCDKVRRIALDQLDQIAHKIADLQSMQRVLSDMAARCTGATVPDCPILDALFAGVISPAPSRPSRYRPRP